MCRKGDDARRDFRPAHPGSTLADLYDPDVMPTGLHKAHRALDAAVDRLYRNAPSSSTVIPSGPGHLDGYSTLNASVCAGGGARPRKESGGQGLRRDVDWPIGPIMDSKAHGVEGHPCGSVLNATRPARWTPLTPHHGPFGKSDVYSTLRSLPFASKRRVAMNVPVGSRSKTILAAFSTRLMTCSPSTPK